MDGRRFIDAMFASNKAQSITQVVMNLPKDAAEFLGMLLYSTTELALSNTRFLSFVLVLWLHLRM